ncbi:acyl-CoA dehydratase activase [Selenihalanaerobacter shriftii]|uniref:CoA-substrate-specific enzyme activase, putative n=1 Tax=Selenihalanaerobacter shriftii TaxID=142842 RepID=A0A1T4L226_9FIRM|nr:acyl-CoA dehydratase activase [Selenihalanaerobacter shriftii]SJZ48759.1 CoA-substrate-specific enzyme activase, putative [Selenihalanaerobacter shriftii]
MKGYLGIDVGSVSTNLVVIDSKGEVLDKLYLRTQGQPIDVVQRGLKKLKTRLADELEIRGIGTTGSGRNLTSVIVGADTVKNEITAHAVASSHIVPDVQTVLEIGGQDSKITILRNGIVVDFAMNTVCAAGTGSFLDQQAARLGIPIEEFGDMALKSENKVRIAGRCSVFAESDMIHKQQMGHSLEDIIAGLCEALVRNYLNNVGQGKDILAPVVFQGGVAANAGIKEAFAEELETEIIVPKHHDVMGAIGAALLAKEEVAKKGGKTDFKGWNVTEIDYTPASFECDNCANLCEVIEIRMNGELVSRWGYRCNRWDLA